VRSIHAAWERGDFSSAEWAHPDVECTFAGGPDPRSSTGLAGMAESMRSWVSAWEDFRVQAEEFRELDAERVLVLTHLSARGKTSGLELGQTWTLGAALWHIRNGGVTRLVIYFDRKRAFVDLGLVPEAGAAGHAEPVVVRGAFPVRRRGFLARTRANISITRHGHGDAAPFRWSDLSSRGRVSGQRGLGRAAPWALPAARWGVTRLRVVIASTRGRAAICLSITLAPKRSEASIGRDDPATFSYRRGRRPAASEAAWLLLLETLVPRSLECSVRRVLQDRRESTRMR